MSRFHQANPGKNAQTLGVNGHIIQEFNKMLCKTPQKKIEAPDKWGPFLCTTCSETHCPQAQVHRDSGSHGSVVARKRLIPPSPKDDFGSAEKYGKVFHLFPTYYCTMFHIPTIKLPQQFTAPVLLIISRTYQLSLYRQPFPDIKINHTCHNVKFSLQSSWFWHGNLTYLQGVFSNFGHFSLQRCRKTRQLHPRSLITLWFCFANSLVGPWS